VKWDKPVDKIHAQRLAVAWVEYACNGSTGRLVTDPIYRKIVEGRTWAKYSSCADLAHWLYYRLGVRRPFVNRDEHRGWKSQVNIGRLAFLPTDLAFRPDADVRLEPGDVTIVWNSEKTLDAHVSVVIDHVGEVVLTADYGQPGGKLRVKKLLVKNGKPHLSDLVGSRQLRVRIPLHALLLDAQSRGELLDYEEPLQGEGLTNE
jgi:hypothetical protein